MTEMQAAIGRKQLCKLYQWVERRRQHASVLTQCFSEIPSLRVATPPACMRNSYYKYYVYVRSGHLGKGWSRNEIIKAINAEGIPCMQGTCCEIYREKAFEKFGLNNKHFPVAKNLAETSLMFHVHPTLTDHDLRDTCTAVEKVLSVAMQQE
jgi:dTDP-4-amino-4,6-dideoxygalactose transaminase